MFDSEVLRLPGKDDVDALFPLIYQSEVTQTIAWDGPASEREYREAWPGVVLDASAKRRHFFSIVDPATAGPVGTCDVRPDDSGFRASLGLWIARPFQSRGLGTRVVADLVRYAFEVLGLCKLDAMVFCGNSPSRRIFEKNGFLLEGTNRSALLKRGTPVDEWHFGLVNQAHPLLRHSVEPAALG